jgi:hypothetical protein
VGKKLPKGIEPGAPVPVGLPGPRKLNPQNARNILGLTRADSYKSGLQKWHDLRKEAEQLGEDGRQVIVTLDLAWRSICSELP